MLGLHLKKCFFDWMENLSSVILSNLIYVVITVLTVLSILAIGEINYAGTLALIAIIVMLVDLVSLGVSGLSYGWVRLGKPWFRDFLHPIKTRFTHFLLKWVIDFASLSAVIIGIPYYLTILNAIGYASALICFWFGILSFLTMQFYYPLSAMMEKDSPVKTLKKSMVIMWDNLGYAFVLAFKCAIELVLTVFTAGFVPGFSGINISRACMTKFLMLRYTYMEENKTDKRTTDWNLVLHEERLENTKRFGKAEKN